MTLPDSRVFEGRTGPSVLTDIARVLDETWHAHPQIPSAICTQVSIATGEIVANIVEHAAQGGVVPIRMEVHVLPGEVHVTFADAGAPMTVDLDSASFPDDMAERGRGLALAKAALAELSYRRDATNHWKLVSKRFA